MKKVSFLLIAFVLLLTACGSSKDAVAEKIEEFLTIEKR